MKKLLGIVVLGLLLGGNAYAEEKFITFKKCYPSSLGDDGRENLTFDINIAKKTVTRTTIWDDDMVEKYKDQGLRKIEQTEHKIKAVGKRFISTDWPNELLGIEFVFDLKKNTIQVSVRGKYSPDTYTLICER